MHLAALVGLAALASGCGGDDPVPVAEDRGPAAEPAPEPDKPSWPEEGCDVRSHLTQDFVEGAKGADTLEDALAPYVPEGGRVVEEPEKPHRERRWLAVDADNRIVAAVGAFDGGKGWLVSTVEECGG
jgi:hypothetical protein